MPDAPAVSVITIFLNEERFIAEAIESVLAQTFQDFELLLLDDGSTDGSSAIARRYAAQHPGRIRYLDHPGHANRGMSATRNLGLAHARGRFLAFLDADDVWRPGKLAAQVPDLDRMTDVGMHYCTTEYWRSWTGRPEDRDTLYQPVTGEVVFDPPELLTRFLSVRILMPCIGSVLVRRDLVAAIGGWEESFRGLYEDQVFFAKLCLAARIRITPECNDRYRQHDASCCAVGARTGEEAVARRAFLRWLDVYAAAHPACDQALAEVIRAELARG